MSDGVIKFWDKKKKNVEEENVGENVEEYVEENVEKENVEENVEEENIEESEQDVECREGKEPESLGRKKRLDLDNWYQCRRSVGRIS